MILLDTNIVSVPLTMQPHPGAVAWFESQSVADLVTSAIVVMELKFGVAALPDGKRRLALGRDVDRVLENYFRGAILPFDETTAGVYADLAARMRREGVSVGQSDMMIAATALQHGATVATRNIRHFEPCGVAVTNPFEGS